MPLIVSALPVVTVCPHKSSVVLLLTSTGPVPRALELLSRRVKEPPAPPLLSVIPPLKLLLPDSVTITVELAVIVALSAPLPPSLADTVRGLLLLLLVSV